MPIELTGMEVMLQKLRQVNKNVEFVKEVALKAGAEIIRKEIRAKAQWHVKRTTGWAVKAGKIYAIRHLKDNIIISRVSGQGSNQFVLVGPEKHFFYGFFSEFGTVKQKPIPFVEPAFIEKRKEALSTIADVIREAIERVEK